MVSSDHRQGMERLLAIELPLYSMEHHLIRHDRPFHPSVKHLAYAHEGRRTSCFYLASICLGRSGQLQPLMLLEALRQLQVSDPGHVHNGAFRWYKEEDRVYDSNAAFFTELPLLALLLTMPDSLEAQQRELIESMLHKSIPWFRKEIEHHIFYYTNKIVSDGAMLMGLSYYFNESSAYGEAQRFVEQWLGYTESRGWGWGENMSIIYSAVTLQAMMLLSICMEEGPLLDRLCSLAMELIENMRFHNGRHMVPSIRSYNFEGNPIYANPELWRVFGVERTEDAPLYSLQSSDPWGIMTAVPLLLSEHHRLGDVSGRIGSSAMRIQRIFDESRATTWMGKRSGLGSVNVFPVMKGSYQWTTGGLGWQSFPVAFSIEDVYYGFLRWTVNLDGGSENRCHPALDKASKEACLFPDAGGFPDITTHSAQNGPRLIVLRTISGLHHTVSLIADEWAVPRFRGKVFSWTSGKGISWFLVQCGASIVAVAPLKSLMVGWRELGVPLCRQEKGDKDTLRLRTILYEGIAQRKDQSLCQSGWYVEVFENQSASGVRDLLESYTLIDEHRGDGQVPRPDSARLRIVEMMNGEQSLTRMEFDPYML